MPHHPGLAARRFFRSFYHWTILTSANTSKSSNTIGRLQLPAARHALHTTAPACAEDEPRLRISRYKTQPRTKGERRSLLLLAAGKSDRQAVADPNHAGSDGQLSAEKGVQQSAREVERKGRALKMHFHPSGKGYHSPKLRSEKRIRLLMPAADKPDQQAAVEPKQAGNDGQLSAETGEQQSARQGETQRRKRRNRGRSARERARERRQAIFKSESPVLSPFEKPFSSFRPHEAVARYRSPTDLMVEYAMLGAELERARAKYGPTLTGWAKLSGARIEARDLSAEIEDFPGHKIHSVLVSGDYTQVTAAINLVSSLAEPYSGTTLHSQESYPSSSLLPLKHAVRSRQGLQVQVELSLRLEQWMHACSNQDFAKMAVAKGVALEVGLTEERPVQQASPVLAPAKSLMLRGPAKSVREVQHEIVKRAMDWKVPEGSSSEQLGPGTVHESVAEPPFDKDETVKPASWDPPTPSILDTPEAQEGEKSLSDSEEPLVRRRLLIGAGATIKDAIWDDLARCTWPDVRIFRHSDRARPRLAIEVVGSKSAVTPGMARVRAKVAETVERLQLSKSAVTCKSEKRGVMSSSRYVLTLTGKDALKVLDGGYLQRAFKKMDTESPFAFKPYDDISHSTEDEEWHVRFRTNPISLRQVEEQLLETIREAARELQASDVKGVLKIETWDEELPGTAESARHIPTIPMPPKALPMEGAMETVNVESTSPVELRSEAQLALPATSITSQDTRGAAAPLVRYHQSAIRSPEQLKQLAEDMRVSLRSLTYPVALITSRVTDKQPSEIESARGVTVSSFNTVTLDPKPIISFNLKVPSRSWDAMEQSQRLFVHLFRASRRGAALAQLFTKPYDRPEMPFEELREIGPKIGVHLDVGGYANGPCISDTRGVVTARLSADLLPEKCVRVGDHVVVLAEVTKINSHPGVGIDGLAYTNRGYRSRWREITPSWASEPDSEVDPMSAAEGPRPTRREHRQRGSEGVSTRASERTPTTRRDRAKAISERRQAGIVRKVAQRMDATTTSEPDPYSVAERTDFVPLNAPERTPTTGRDEAETIFERKQAGIARLVAQRMDATRTSEPDSYSIAERTEDLEQFFALSVDDGKDETSKIHEAHSLGEDEGAPPRVHDAAPTNTQESEEGTGRAAAEESGKPTEPPTETSAIESAQQNYVPFGADVLQPESPHVSRNMDDKDPHASYNMDDDEVFSSLRAAKAAAMDPYGGRDIFEEMSWEDEDMDSDGKARATSSKASGSPSKKPTKASGSPAKKPSSKREFSTLSPLPGSRRSFSSKAIALRGNEDDSHTLEPAAKNTTVADYLGVPDDNVPLHSPRVRSLIRFRKEIQRAELRLATEELSEEEATGLRDTIVHQERIIARKLAWNAAADLRLMLDKGSARVNFQRAQWLESAVEQGLKVLLDDARTLRRKRKEGKVDVREYEMLKTQLESDHGVLQTELMRLRGVVDEDEEGGSE